MTKNNMNRGFIKNITNITVVIIVLAIVFFSQQPYFSAFNQIQSWRQMAYMAYDYVKQNVISIIGGEAEKRKEIIQEELKEEKNKISEVFWKKIKNYFLDIIYRIFNPSAPADQLLSAVPEAI